MAINISPNRINIQSGNAGKSGAGQRKSPSNEERIIIPAKAVVNNIPSPESMQTMIRSAVDSLRKGVFWDRGTILNLVI
ncbi:MAG: hypothetical protein ABL857_08290 [Rickettsiales bacterium]|jgi:hypothetical protein